MVFHFFLIYIIKIVFCHVSVCPDTYHASISQPISKLSTSMDSPGTVAALSHIFEIFGNPTIFIPPIPEGRAKGRLRRPFSECLVI